MRFIAAFVFMLALGCSDPTPAQTGTAQADVAADAIALDTADTADSSAGADAPDAADTVDLVDAPDANDSAAGTDAAVTSDSTADIAADTGICAPCSINCVCKKGWDGCPVQECESATCLDLFGKIDAEKAKLTPCAKPGGLCGTFEFPICGSMGCFQAPMGEGADTAAIGDLSTQAMKAQCSGFHCGCGPTPPALCLKGQCRQCPPDCGGACEELGMAIQNLVETLNFCGKDQDCQVLTTGLCPLGKLPCGGAAVSTYADTAGLKAATAAYLACGAAMCKCAAPKIATCVKGRCAVP